MHTPYGQGETDAVPDRGIAGCEGELVGGVDHLGARYARIRAQVGDGKAICGLSGGVDWSVAALLVHRAIGDQLTCVFVDHGLMRKDEGEQVVSAFRDTFGVPLAAVDAEERAIRRVGAT